MDDIITCSECGRRFLRKIEHEHHTNYYSYWEERDGESVYICPYCDIAEVICKYEVLGEEQVD